MPERVTEASRPANSPWHLMIANQVSRTVSAGLDGTSNDRIGVARQHFKSDGCCPSIAWARKTVGRLVQDERRVTKFQRTNGAETPQFDGAERLLVPLRRFRRVLHGQHERHGRIRHQTSRLCFSAASTNPAKRGCGSKGRLFSSG